MTPLEVSLVLTRASFWTEVTLFYLILKDLADLLTPAKIVDEQLDLLAGVR